MCGKNQFYKLVRAGYLIVVAEVRNGCVCEADMCVTCI